MYNYSLSDIAAVTGNEGFGGMGGGWLAWILLFALFGGNGFGFGNRGNFVTEADLCNANSFSELKNSVGRLNDNQAAIARQTDNAICQIGYQNLQNTSALASQIADCCCNTQLGVQQVRYDMAVQNGDIKSLIHAEAEATRNMMRDTENANLRQQLGYAQLQQALCGIPRTNPYGYGIYAYPACNPCGCAGNGAF